MRRRISCVSGSRRRRSFPVLSLTSFSPTSASSLDTVMIYGKAFTGASAVTFGGTAAGSYTVLYDSVIRAIISTGSTGVISVTTTQGSVSSAGTFTFVPAQDTSVPAPPDTTAPAPLTTQGERLVCLYGWHTANGHRVV